jgi:hypothetical protein
MYNVTYTVLNLLRFAVCVLVLMCSCLTPTASSASCQPCNAAAGCHLASMKRAVEQCTCYWSKILAVVLHVLHAAPIAYLHNSIPAVEPAALLLKCVLVVSCLCCAAVKHQRRLAAAVGPAITKASRLLLSKHMTSKAPITC